MARSGGTIIDPPYYNCTALATLLCLQYDFRSGVRGHFGGTIFDPPHKIVKGRLDEVHQEDPVHQVNETDEVHQVNEAYEVYQIIAMNSLR